MVLHLSRSEPSGSSTLEAPGGGFCSRQSWAGQVAYHSQFISPTDRAWSMKAKINSSSVKGEASIQKNWTFRPSPSGCAGKPTGGMNPGLIIMKIFSTAACGASTQTRSEMISNQLANSCSDIDFPI